MDHDLLARLDQMARDAGPALPVDQVQVQREVNAYLLQRGRDLATDMDLGPQPDEDLMRLGELDCIAQHPDLPPGMAVDLAMFEAEQQVRTDQAVRSWHDHVAHHHRQGHRHACNETCPEDGPGPATAPEPGTTVTPDIRGMGPSNALDPCRGGSGARAEPESAARNGKIDR